MDAIEYVAEDGIMHLMYDVDSWGVDRVDQRYLPLDEKYNPKCKPEFQILLYHLLNHFSLNSEAVKSVDCCHISLLTLRRTSMLPKCSLC